MAKDRRPLPHDREHLPDQNQGPGSPDDRKDNQAREKVPIEDPDAEPPYGPRG